jgi:DNA-binding MarR family transcriptional regulator
MKGNILNMSSDRQWLDLALGDLPPANAHRVRALRLLLAQAGRLRTLLDRELAPSGITTQQGALLSWIEAQSTPPTLSAVAAALAMTHQNAKQIAAALQRKGFLAIEVDPGDRRARRLRLTEQHRQFWQQRNPSDFAAVLRWTAVWNDEEVRQLVDLLGRLNRHLQAGEAQARAKAGAEVPAELPGRPQVPQKV